MSGRKKQLGKTGEELAVSFLKKSYGYRIIRRNYRCVFGEIDIIAKDHDVLSFIEVRSRSSLYFGDPKESITMKKQRQISKVALEFINKHQVQYLKARFDVVTVLLLPRKERMELIKNAFELSVQ